MGLSALTRKGWKENPRKQGTWNLIASIVACILIPCIGYVFRIEDMASAIIITPIFLLWGVCSFIGGIILDKINKKAQENDGENNC